MARQASGRCGSGLSSSSGGYVPSRASLEASRFFFRLSMPQGVAADRRSEAVTCFPGLFQPAARLFPSRLFRAWSSSAALPDSSGPRPAPPARREARRDGFYLDGSYLRPRSRRCPPSGWIPWSSAPETGGSGRWADCGHLAELLGAGLDWPPAASPRSISIWAIRAWAWAIWLSRTPDRSRALLDLQLPMRSRFGIRCCSALPRSTASWRFQLAGGVLWSTVVFTRTDVLGCSSPFPAWAVRQLLGLADTGSSSVVRGPAAHPEEADFIVLLSLFRRGGRSLSRVVQPHGDLQPPAARPGAPGTFWPFPPAPAGAPPAAPARRSCR